jgi:hypothetical protein
MAFAARTLVNGREFRQWDTENVKHCDQSVSQSQTHPSNSFIVPRARQDPFLAAYHATASPKQAKKFHVFHQRHFWKATNVQEDRAPAEYPVVATSHSQQDPGIMRKAVRQSINGASRQPNSKKTSRDLRVIHDLLNLVQTTPRNFGVDMDKPKDVAVCGTCSSIHLYRPVTLAYYKLITKIPREIARAIGTSTISDDNFSARCLLAQVSKKWSYKHRLIKDRDNNRDLRLSIFHQSFATDINPRNKTAASCISQQVEI